MNQILLIEDDKKISSFVTNGLQEAGYAVSHLDNGAHGYEILTLRTFDVAIVDILLPGMDGFTIVEKARQNQVQTPVLFLSAKREVDDRIKGLRIGGDDYLVKPFSFTELLERIRALLRRSSGYQESINYTIADVELNIEKHVVTRSSKSIDLNNQEFKLLAYLIRNAGKVVSKTMIMDNVWDYYFDPQTNVVEATMCRLRTKLNDGFDEKLIRNIRGVGYVIEETE